MAKHREITEEQSECYARLDRALQKALERQRQWMKYRYVIDSTITIGTDSEPEESPDVAKERWEAHCYPSGDMFIRLAGANENFAEIIPTAGRERITIMAAAPELLDVLEKIETHWNPASGKDGAKFLCLSDDFTKWIKRVIKKARGGA